jgi:ribokinase
VTGFRPDVVVVGDALLDVTARPVTPMRTGADVPAEVRIGCGGQGANLAIRLARRGVAVELVCALGDDPGGTIVRDALTREGVALSSLGAAATGTVVILLDQRAERTMLSQRAPFASAAAAAVHADAGWLLVSGYLLSEPAADDLARGLAEMPARRALVGCTVPDVQRDAWLGAAAALRPDLVIVNRDEATALLPGPTSAHDLADRLGRRLGCGLVVTDPSGATASLNGVAAAVRGPDDRPASDTTGAGDAFAAALVASLIRAPWPPRASALEAALTVAAEAGSAVAHAAGAQGEVAGERDASLRT